ncbi:acetyltransferase [Pseudomonas putida]|uniref:Acetyltransferase n=1 Tax=Pseudomonas putida TaxID=303 RepID=A0A2Z4RI73_PSEPU|nr:acetyltransferase [Pseudomonas putida]AWY40666.1 acetyltransferase [Pseudomonas putida]
MTNYVVLGEGDALESACRVANDLGMTFVGWALSSADRYSFKLDDFFASYVSSDTEVFVALDERAVNYSRHKLIAQVRLAGYRLFNLVSPKAIVDEGVQLMGNVFIGAGCNLADKSVVGLGCWLDRQVTMDRSVRLGSCVTLFPGVTLGREVVIGKGSTLSTGSLALEGTKVGHHCEWLLGGQLPALIPDQSFYDRLMPDGARILKI